MNHFTLLFAMFSGKNVEQNEEIRQLIGRPQKSYRFYQGLTKTIKITKIPYTIFLIIMSIFLVKFLLISFSLIQPKQTLLPTFSTFIPIFTIAMIGVFLIVKFFIDSTILSIIKAGKEYCQSYIIFIGSIISIGINFITLYMFYQTYLQYSLNLKTINSLYEQSSLFDNISYGIAIISLIFVAVLSFIALIESIFVAIESFILKPKNRRINNNIKIVNFHPNDYEKIKEIYTRTSKPHEENKLFDKEFIIFTQQNEKEGIINYRVFLKDNEVIGFYTANKYFSELHEIKGKQNEKDNCDFIKESLKDFETIARKRGNFSIVVFIKAKHSRINEIKQNLISNEWIYRPKASSDKRHVFSKNL